MWQCGGAVCVGVYSRERAQRHDAGSAIPAAGLGIALKAEDGALRGSEGAMAELLLKLLPAPTPEERALLDELRLPRLKNWVGTNVGHLGVTVASIR